MDTDAGVKYFGSDDLRSGLPGAVDLAAVTLDSHSLAHAIHEAINDVRRSSRLRTLRWEEKLAAAATQHSVAMAEQQFFSHESPIAGHETPSARAAQVGGDFISVGENLCMLARGSTASRFVDQWVTSPGHRANLLDPDWELSGVGTATTADGRIMATQLFAVAPRIKLDDPQLTVRDERRLEFRLTARIGRAHSLAAFVRNEFSTSVAADRQGVACLSVELPAEPGSYHLGFGRLPKGGNDAWIGVHDGFVTVEPSGSVRWNPRPSEHKGFAVLEESIYTVTGSSLSVSFSGFAHEDAVCVVDQSLHARFPRGQRFDARLSFRSGSGCHTVDFGISAGETEYSCCRSMEIDSDAGQLRTVR